jgi:glutaconate CoA-transferase subunit B
VDVCGNFNNIALGTDYHHPRLRLPGVGGIPDVTVTGDANYLYVTRHSRVTFVEQCDLISGLGHVSGRTRGAGPRYLVSDLGQFDWAEGRMRLTSFHPGTSIDHIRAKTGFELAIAADVRRTLPPTADELCLLRQQIDPLGVRRLETLGGAARRELLRAILAAENAL